jgi:hypothetical protein
MTMNIFAPSNTVRVGDVIQLPFYCSEPGDVVFTSSDETVAVVESGITVAGTRVWRNGLKHGQYLAREGASTAARESQTFLFRVRTADLIYTPVAAAYTPNRQYYLQNNRMDAGRRMNWGFLLCTQNLSVSGTTGHQFFVIVGLSQTSSAVDTYMYSSIYYVSLVQRGGYINIAFTMTTGASKTYVGNLTNVTNSTITFSGTMGGVEYLTQNGPIEWAKYNSILSNATLTDFLENDVWPSGQVIAIKGGHEIDPTAPVFWDTSGNNLDLSAVNVPYWPEAAASGDYTDDPGNPVVPYTSFQVVAQSVGTSTITARRRRNGVPYRTPPLSDAEVYEETTYNLTVEAPLASEQSVLQLMIYADRDGTATISMDNPIIDFPASIAVVEGKNQVSGIATGSGTCNVTVEMNGSSSVTTFNIEEIVTVVSSGPPQNLRARI